MADTRLKLYFINVLLVIVACGQLKPTTPSKFMFDETKIGPVIIGESRGEVLRALEKASLKWEETDWISEGKVVGTRIEIYDGGVSLFDALIDKNIVAELRTTNPTVRTQGNLGVGATFRELNQAFRPSPKLITNEDGLTVVYEFQTSLLRFGLDVPEYSNTFPPQDTKITFVSIVHLRN